MAYRDPQTLTCPGCGKIADLVWVVGEGPNTRPGQGPDYVDILDPGCWAFETRATAPTWRGTIRCPDCGKTVLKRFAQT